MKIILLVLTLSFTGFISAQTSDTATVENYYSLVIDYNNNSSSGNDSVFIVSCVLGNDITETFDKVEIQTGMNENSLSSKEYSLDKKAGKKPIVIDLGEAGDNLSVIEVSGIDSKGKKTKLKKEK
jgi:hypothetical protein